MIKLRIVTVLLIYINCFFVQAQIIEEPEVNLPQDQFYKLYNQGEILNPLFFKGNIVSVKQKIKQHISPLSEEEFIENHTYKFNDKKQIVEYSNDLDYYFEYDEGAEIEDLNIKPTLSITNDTIIKQGNFKYTFKKGLLVLKEEQNFESGYRDSIVFHYKKNKLIEHTHFKSIEIYYPDNESNDDENRIVFEEFATKFHQKITYTKSNKIKSYKEYDFNLDVAFTNTIIYNYYGDNRLKNYKQVSNSYNIENVDVYKSPETIVFKKEHVLENYFYQAKGEFKYDSKGRIISYSIIKSNKENEFFNVIYNTTGYTIFLSRNILEISTEALSPQNLEFEYIFDKHNNLVELNEYIMQNEKKIITRSHISDIVYLEN